MVIANIYWAHNLPSSFDALSHLNLKRTLEGSYYYLHMIDEDI